MSEFVNILEDTYGATTPIFTREIVVLFPEISQVALHKRINKALISGKLRRFERGVFYIPEMVECCTPWRETIISEKVIRDDQILRKRYLTDGKEVYGHYSGLQLEYQKHVSPQMPCAIEIVTNHEKSAKRSIGRVGWYKNITLRKARVPVTKENVGALEFIDLITRAPFGVFDELEMHQLKKFAQSLDRSLIIECIRQFPAKASQRFLDYEAIGVFD